MLVYVKIRYYIWGMERIRLTGKELFVFYHKEVGLDRELEVIGCTNKKVLAKMSGLSYDNLVRVFTRERRHYYDNGDVVVMRLYTKNIHKGEQSIARRGKGGMEKFANYIKREGY